MSKEKQAREALEKFFSQPFTDYQWSLVSAQGYEEALVSGARSAEDVALELQGLMEAAGRRPAGAGAGASDDSVEPTLTWDKMERLVLGRILTTGETSGPRLQTGAADTGSRTRRLVADRERGRHRWATVLISCVAVLAVAVVTVMLLLDARCAAGGGRSTTTVTTEPAPSTTTISTMPPTTQPELPASDYFASLSGTEVVPAVETDATGTLELSLSDDGESMEYILSVEALSDFTVARLRVGGPGVNGEEIVTLYNEGTKKGLFSGVVAEWSFNADDFLGPLKGKTAADFIALLDAGEVYVNLGTTTNRDGELRGQLQ